MSRKRNHRMRPEVRRHMQAGTIAATFPDQMASWNQLHAEEVVVQNMNLMKASLVRFLEGTAQAADLARLGGEINTCWIALENSTIEGRELVQQRLQAAGQALEEAKRLRARHGRLGLTGPGRQALGEGVDAIELALRATTPRQMKEAEQALRQHLARMERAPA